MSTIHTALSRAQQQKDAMDGPYPGSSSASASPRPTWTKRFFLIFGGILLLAVVAYTGFLFANRATGKSADQLAKAPDQTELQQPQSLTEEDDLETVSFLESEDAENPVTPMRRKTRGTLTVKRPEPNALGASQLEEPGEMSSSDHEMANRLASSRYEDVQEINASDADLANILASSRHEDVQEISNRDSEKAHELAQSQMDLESVQDRDRQPPPDQDMDAARPRPFRRQPRMQNAWTMAKEQMRRNAESDSEADTAQLVRNITVETLRAEKEFQPVTVMLEPDEDPPAVVASRWYEKGLDSQLQGNHQQAISYYTRSLSEDPSYAPSLNNRAVIYMEQGDLEAAKKDFSQAMVQDSLYVDPCYNLACLHARQGELDEALSYLKIAVEMDKEVLDWVQEDDDLAVIRGMDEFKEVMNE